MTQAAAKRATNLQRTQAQIRDANWEAGAWLQTAAERMARGDAQGSATARNLFCTMRNVAQNAQARADAMAAEIDRLDGGSQEVE